MGSSIEARRAMETMKCPRCGGGLRYRDVLNRGGLGWAISQEFYELYDIYGHSFSIRIKDFIIFFMRESFWRRWSIGVCAGCCSRSSSLSLLTDSLVIGCTLVISPPFLFQEKAGKIMTLSRSNDQSILLRIGRWSGHFRKQKNLDCRG